MTGVEQFFFSSLRAYDMRKIFTRGRQGVRGVFFKIYLIFSKICSEILKNDKKISFFFFSFMRNFYFEIISLMNTTRKYNMSGGLQSQLSKILILYVCYSVVKIIFYNLIVIEIKKFMFLKQKNNSQS